MWMNISQGKGNHATTFRHIWSIHGQTWDSPQLFQSIRSNFLFVLEHVLHAKRIEVIDSHSQANRFGYRWCSSFQGRSFQVDSRNPTLRIISPPPIKGGIASSRSRFP